MGYIGYSFWVWFRVARVELGFEERYEGVGVWRSENLKQC